MVPLTQCFTRIRRDSSGAELVEAALTFPLLLLVVLGILDFGLLFQQYEVITNAAREGARVAVLPQPYQPEDAEARVRQYIDAAFLARNPEAATVSFATHDVPLGDTCMRTVTVTVTYPHEYLFLGGIAKYFDANSDFGTKELVASSTMRSEVEAGACQ